MKALFIREHGSIDRLEYGELENPSVSLADVLIKVEAAALNHLDIWVREGAPGIKVGFPHVLGSDGAGVVVEKGAQVNNVEVGDKVLLNPGLSCESCEFCKAGEHSECSSFHLLGEHVNGTFAKYVKAPYKNVHPIPPGMSFEQAAAFPLVFLTSWRMLVSKAKVKRNEVILINGVGGGVSSASLQIAKMMELKAIVTSGNDGKLKKAEELGADEMINYKKSNLSDEVKKITGKRGVDIVLDNVGEATWEDSLGCLARGGRLVTCGATSGNIGKTDISRVFWNQISILGSTMGNRREFLDILEAFKSGKLKPVIDKVFSLKDGVQAQAYMEEGKQFGKVILKTKG